MALAREYLERRAIRVALETYLGVVGWTGLTFAEGYGSDQTIEKPLVAVSIIAPRKAPLQLGGGGKFFKRNVQVDLYMESEHRASGLVDDVMDFIELTPVQIVDGSSNNLGSIICQDDDTINGDILPPVLTDPSIKRWRGIVKSVWEAYYNE